MKVIIIAANAQKAAIADSLVQDEKLSKVLLTISSKKLVEEAQALIIYFESKDDLNRLENILKIYTGVPLKFYFGDKPYKNFQHYFHFKDSKKMVESISREFTKLQHAADQIYDKILLKDQSGKTTVETLLTELKARDIIEEKCIEFFSNDKETSHKHASAKTQKKKKNDPKDIEIDKNKFRKWWTQSKQDNFEFIKYYISGWLAKQVKEKKIDDKMIKKLRDFRGYQMRRKQIRILKEHYESTFSLKVHGKRVTPLPVPAAGTDAQSKAKVSAQQDAGKVEETKQNKDAPSDPSSNAAAPLEETNPHEKAGTEIEVKVTFFPDKGLEAMVNLKNLHLFYDQWVSIGFKPKQKDLKTFIEDLNSFEYLQQLKDELSYDTSIVLDGKKVRLGLQHQEQLDPKVFFSEDQKDSLDLLEELKVIEEQQEQEAQFQFNISLGKKLIEIIKSDEPLLVSLMESMAVESSMKFHLKQFKKGFETLLEGKQTTFVEDLIEKKKEAAKVAAEEAKRKLEKEKEAKKKASKKGAKDAAEDEEEIKSADKEELSGEEDKVEDEESQNKDERRKKQEEEEDDENDEENEDDEDEDEEDEYDGEIPDDEGVEEEDDDDEQDQEEGEGQDKKADDFNFEEILKSLIPLMLFKWNANVKLSPDLDEFVEYCKVNKEKSILFKSFSEAFKGTQQDQQETSTKTIRRGTKAELIAYLIEEMGPEVEIAWKTTYFFLQARIKSQDLGSVLDHAYKANIIE